MDLMKIFKRQKSVTQKKDFGSPSGKSAVIAPVNSTTYHGKHEKSASKFQKGWKKSFQQSFRRKKSFQSSSCDNILQGSEMPMGSQDFAELELSHPTYKRWSYSPECSEEHTARLQNLRNFRRHTDTALKSNNNQPFVKAPPFSYDADTLNQLTTSLVDAQCEESISCLQLQGNSSGTRAAVSDPVMESAFKELNQNQEHIYSGDYDNLPGEKDVPGVSSRLVYADIARDFDEDGMEDHSSWGSNEFESDSEDDSFVHQNDTYEEDLVKLSTARSFFKKNREISKDITDGMRKLKFLQRKGLAGKKTSKASEDESASFINVKMPQERHPGPHLGPPRNNLLPYQLRRRNIIQTIIRSESLYIDSLEKLEITYKKALMDSRPSVISAELVERIFYKVADILQCHQIFQIALTAAVNDWDLHETIGDTFVASFSKAMVLECYSCYINNFTSAMELVRKACKQKPLFLAFVQEQQEDSKDHLNLYGLMLKPVQRFPQFIMLVQDLLKNTPDDHGDYLPLQLALTELETLAENLNRRRADEEQRTDLLQLLESSNIKLTSDQTKDGRVRRLLKQGFVREITHSEDGAVEKDRKCLLVLTNDMLLSCSCSNRWQQAKSSISTFRDLYKLKWCTALDILKITNLQQEFHNSEQTKVKSDIETLQSLNKLIMKLNHPLPGLTVDQIQLHISSLEAKLNHAERITDTENAFAIQFQQKSADFRRTLVMPDSILHNDWLESIINAKLADDHRNLQCWFSSDGSDSEILWRPPLFLESVDCVKSQKTLQVQCAFAFMPACHVTLLWLACSASTVVATVNIYRIENEKTEKVHAMQVESSVQCMEHWCSDKDACSVWLGMECGSLIEFATVPAFTKLCEVAMPTMSTVMIMKAFEKNLYAGLLDGSLVMYKRPEVGHKGLIQVRSITVGSGPLNCLSRLKGKLWGTSGNDIVTIELENFSVESIRTIHTEEHVTVSHVVQVGSGFWVAFRDTCNLRLYHLDSLKLLQDLNLSRPIRDFFQGNKGPTSENWSVTVLWSAYYQLLVGTSNGLILTMPLPRLAGSVPKITGPCLICRHMLSSAVQYLCAPEMPSSNRDENALEHYRKDNPPEIPERSPINPNRSTRQAALFHRRTSSEGLQGTTEVSERNEMNKRLSSIYPHSASGQILDEQSTSLIPPALPPKPSTPKKKSAVTEKMLEGGFQFGKSDEDQIPKSAKRENNRVNGKSRNFPVLLACGDGYSYCNVQDDDDYQPASSKTTSLLSWKIVM